jgi:hypothetical protein
VFTGVVDYERYGLPDMDVHRMYIQADLSRCLTCQILPTIETPFLGYKVV